MLTNSFLGYVGRFLKCGEPNIPAAAARFLVGSAEGYRSDGGSGYRTIDARIQRALERFSMEVRNVDRSQASHLGRLYTRPGGFVLKIRRDIHESTYRFVRAHELGHVLAYDTSGQEPRRCFVNSTVEEKLCDMIARWLLLPEELLSTRLDAIGFSGNFPLDELVLLSREYLVTPWQIVRRAIERDAGKTESIVGVLWKKESDGVLRVRDSVSPAGVFVPLSDRSFKDGRENRAAWEAIQSSKVLYGEDQISLGSLRGCLASVSFACSSPGPSVVQILTLDERHVAKSSRWRATRYETSKAFVAAS